MARPTARELFRRTARFQRGGGLPRFEAMGFWDETLQRWRGEGLPADRSPWEFFGLEQFMDNAPPEISYHTDRVISNAYWPPFEERTLEETGDQVVRLQADGIVARQLKHGTSVPQFLEYPLKSESDWPAIRERLDPHRPERYAAVPAAADRLRGRAHVLRFGLCGAYGFLRNLFGPENLCYALYDAPEFLHRLLEHWLRFNCALADHLCPLIDFDYVFVWEDMAYKNGPLMSPAHFRLFILPRYRELLGYLRRRHGLDLVMVDSDGDNWQLLPLFLEGGVNLFTPLEIAAGMEPLELRRRFPELVLLGGIDKRALLSGREAIRAELERKVPAMLESGGYFPCLDHHVPADIGFEAFCQYLEMLRAIEGQG
jgi:hypothetical protein